MTVDTWDSLPLWDHQRAAVEALKNYIRSNSSQGALVHMPTGTGKTGVIAAMARCVAQQQDVLILTPWRTLRHQMKTDIERGFWETLGVDPGRWPKRIEEFTPSTIGRLLAEPSLTGSAYIGTIQALQWLHARSRRGDQGFRQIYDSLRASLSLVIVDEGHYEPAPEWSTAVRELDIPTVLFTATPYRNDFKAFDIATNHIFTLSYQEAVRRRFIRRVQFREERFRSLEEFGDKLVEFFHGDFRDLAPSDVADPKVIVRCAKMDSVRSLTRYLINQHGQRAIGVHERFASDGPGYLSPRVPDPRSAPYTFWVHQYKLMEGVDNPDFCLVAFYDAFSSGRPYVQQVGRVIRNPRQTANQNAWVYGHPRSQLATFWRAFESFEEAAEAGEAFYFTEQEEPVYQRFLDAQRPVEYVGGNFRKRLDEPSEVDFERELLFPRTVQVFKTEAGFDQTRLADDVRAQAGSGSRELFAEQTLDSNSLLVLWMRIWNSPLLRTQAFLSCELGFTLYRVVQDLVFFADSGGETPEYLSGPAGPVEAEILRGLFGTHADSRVVDLSLTNTDVGTHSLRARSMRARDLGQSAPSVSDHGYFVSTATGYKGRDNERPLRRYVGFSRGRVSETSGSMLGLRDYMSWLDDLTSELQRGRSPGVPVFGRFAEFSSAPNQPQARNILLDVEDVRQRYWTRDPETGAQLALEIDDVCMDVDGEGTASGSTAPGVPFTMTVKYVTATERFQLEADGLADYLDPDTDESLVTFLNREQSFRIIPESASYMYAHGRWFRPKHPVTGTSARSLDLFTLFHPVTELGDIGSEKGSQCQPEGQGWEDNSLFDLIDRLGLGSGLADFLEDTSVLVCDDLDKEVADFIACSDPSVRGGFVAFIHAKAYSREKKRSASAFAEVCSQAVKNLDYLQAYSYDPPPNYRRWNSRWQVTGVGSVATRIRRPRDAMASEAWDAIRKVVRDPSASREVWLVLGQAFSNGEFEDRLHRSRPEPEDRQIAYLLQSTWNAVSSVGARLRVFCSQ